MRFKNTLRAVCIGAALLVSSGCTSVPKSQISYSAPNGGSLKLDLPKDVELTGLEIDLSGPKPIVRLGEYRARMNPEVIANSAAGQAEFLRELKGLLSQMAQYGGAGMMGKPPVVAPNP